jgi:cold shock CspA family protein
VFVHIALSSAPPHPHRGQKVSFEITTERSTAATIPPPEQA